ncbi:hypothetical protein QL285_013584 [Trifolium repens]|nr:hypothetical protein QL285_013584 [Trifolium repens]
MSYVAFAKVVSNVQKADVVVGKQPLLELIEVVNTQHVDDVPMDLNVSYKASISFNFALHNVTGGIVHGDIFTNNVILQMVDNVATENDVGTLEGFPSPRIPTSTP